jgi:NDP-sugar pyrophosphorylase family protein
MPSLVVLAGGLGSRFGGLKQTAELGPNGETLLEYAVFDAARAGVRRVVFVIRPEMAGTFPDWAERRFGSRVAVRCALQRLDEAPIEPPVGRKKPWGTAHAVLTAAALVDEPFLAVNADDFYGRDGYARLAAALAATAAERDTWHLATWPLRATLSVEGTVNRALCEVDEAGRLTGLEERTGLSEATIPREWLDRPVSMNMWGFTPSVFAAMSDALAMFFATGDLERGECLLPDVVGQRIRAGAARVQVHGVKGRWAGVTHAADVPRVREHLAALHEQGDYPPVLWP